jgi:uncharacterized protein (TIGR02145 family)
MCYNLGAANTTKDPFVFTTNDTTILGKFYQWGRTDANHRAANDTTNFTTSWVYPYDWKIPHGYNKTITNSYRQNDFPSSPCPAGWHVPTTSAFGAIFNGIIEADVPGNAIANTWTPSGTWTNTTGNGGYAVKPDGVTTTLFFPAAGNRNYRTGALSSVGYSGNYWSITSSSTGAFILSFTNGRVNPVAGQYRGYGLSVRCVAE